MNLPAFGVRNPVPINLMMIVLIIGGVFAAIGLRREFFPEMDSDSLVVSVSYPGASPAEIESAVAARIENALANLDEVDELRTVVNEGRASVTVTFREGTSDVDEAITEVRRAVDSIADLPAEVERPQVIRIKPSMPVIMAELWGEADEQVKKRAIQDIRDDLKSFPGMGGIDLTGMREDELSVEVNRDLLVEHGLSITDVAARVTAWMQDIPGGTLRGKGGDITIRTQGAENASLDVREIVVRSDQDGKVLRLGDIATVETAVVDVPIRVRFNGHPSVGLMVTKSGDQDIVAMAEVTRAYVDGRMGRPFEPTLTERFIGDSARKQAWLLGSDAPPLPTGTTLTTFTDLARFVEGRLSLVTKNAVYGAILVFVLLLLAVNIRVAFWVGMGLVTALSGTLLVMFALGITLNMLTMFGLIVVLGLLVDDAIVVSENIEARHGRGEAPMDAAVVGTNEVLWPVVATVLTSIVAFLPLTFIKGNIGDMLGALPMVVACALAMSLFECLLILPGHLGPALQRRDRAIILGMSLLARRYESARDRFFFEGVVPVYLRLLRLAIRFRYIALTTAISALMVSLGMVAGGRVGYTFVEVPDAETLAVNIRMPVGTPLDTTDAMVRVIEEAANAQDEVQVINTLVGVQWQLGDGATSISTNVGQVFLELTPAETRTAMAGEVIDRIRRKVADAAAAADRITYEMMSGGPGGSDITIQLRGEDDHRLQEASRRIQDDLLQFAGVQDVGDDVTSGQRELRIELRPGASSTGLTVADLARQVRGAVYGIDAHVFARGDEEVDVRVKMDDEVRTDVAALEQLWVMAPGGLAVPLVEVADVFEGEGYGTIRRVDRNRTVTVTAETIDGVSPEQVIRNLPLAKWKADFPDVKVIFGGRQQEQVEAFSTLPIGFAAACVMSYVILAWLFGSYFQPLMIMLGVPFSIVGVIWGHWLGGYDLTFLSLIGFVALSGIVVNDSLILVKFYNDRRGRGMGLNDALIEAGAARIRPILLTTVTTVLGLTPLMLEQSFQARFLIPMAIAIAAGLVSATVLILLLLPALVVIGDDLRRLWGFLWSGPAISSLEPASDA